jgi:hypothetical protein
MSISIAVVWLFNYVVSKETPDMVLHIGWKTWFIYATFNAVGFIFCLFLPETKDLSLEEMDILFRVVDESTRRHDIEQFNPVPSGTIEEKSVDPVVSSASSKENN